ncbi:hypothetical protein BV20DRAFT_1057852 [Pilatotrama ljubarskyi]|nr:hypothetical protein BV20DRAFT_1057852 [Pilatotrama ljubarskyi]
MSTSTDSTPTSPTSGFQSIFQSAGGPPLILVCIAAGLLFGAFVGMFLMKRLRPGVVVQRVNGPGGAGAEVPLGEKPKLYDIYLQPASEESGAEHHPWANVYPFAAVYLPLSGNDAPPTPPSAAPSAPSLLSRVIARLPLRHHDSSRTRAGKGQAPSTPAPQLRGVQLAVTVSMPNPALHAPKSVDVTNDDHEDDPMPDCCIGTTIRLYRPESV